MSTFVRRSLHRSTCQASSSIHPPPPFFPSLLYLHLSLSFSTLFLSLYPIHPSVFFPIYLSLLPFFPPICSFHFSPSIHPFFLFTIYFLNQALLHPSIPFLLLSLPSIISIHSSILPILHPFLFQFFQSIRSFIPSAHLFFPSIPNVLVTHPSFPSSPSSHPPCTIDSLCKCTVTDWSPSVALHNVFAPQPTLFLPRRCDYILLSPHVRAYGSLILLTISVCKDL